MASCTECRRSPAPHETLSGRTLCDSCYRRLAEFTGAGAAMVDGAEPAAAVGRGLAAGAWAGSTRADPAATRRRRERLAAANGFWRRLWIRVWG